MSRNRFLFILLSTSLGVLLLVSGLYSNTEKVESYFTEKVNGVSLVATSSPDNNEHFDDIEQISANWVTIIPFAFSREGEPQVSFNQEWQWYGEKEEGVINSIKKARSLRLKVMLKPHVWISGQGWPGEYDLKTEAEWKTWEADYEKYILAYAKLANDHSVDLFCIGTEFRIAAVKRKKFWKMLSGKVRKLFNGRITYAANWDNYQNVEFWDDVDFIGVDAYFPLSDSRTPMVDELVSSWASVKKDLQTASSRFKKQILLTEYGYESRDYTAKGHWNIDIDTLQVNVEGQKNAYEALYSSLWKEEWVAGGFLWKWFPSMPQLPERETKRYTPQHKPVLETIRIWYGDH